MNIYNITSLPKDLSPAFTPPKGNQYSFPSPKISFASCGSLTREDHITCVFLDLAFFPHYVYKVHPC